MTRDAPTNMPIMDISLFALLVDVTPQEQIEHLRHYRSGCWGLTVHIEGIRLVIQIKDIGLSLSFDPTQPVTEAVEDIQTQDPKIIFYPEGLDSGQGYKDVYTAYWKKSITQLKNHTHNTD